MKQKKTILVFMVLFVSCIGIEVQAQTALKALIKNYETRDDVTISVVENRDPKSKKVFNRVTDISFENEALLPEVLNAFEQDKNSADRVIEEKKGGQTNSIFYVFDDAEFSTSYSYTVSKSGKYNFTMIQNSN